MAKPTERWCDHGDWRHRGACAVPETRATSADLLELDAVPDPVDSDAPTDVHARTLARART